MSNMRIAPHRMPSWGVDLAPENRPGVPKEHAPRPVGRAHWKQPTRQPPVRGALKRAGLTELTPVFSTAVPPRGLSGVLRRAAYRIPDHKVRHWLVLMAADRVDVIEHNPVRYVLPVVVGAAAIGALVMLGSRR